MKWKIIDTAPKDGSLLLLFDDGMYLGSWRSDENYPEEDPSWFDNSFDDFSCGYASVPLSPTHWCEITEPTICRKEKK